MTFKVGCKTTASEPWAYNALRFPTREMAQAYGANLYSRWTALREFEVHESDDPICYYQNGKLIQDEETICSPTN